MCLFLDGSPLSNEESQFSDGSGVASKYAAFVANRGTPGSSFQIRMVDSLTHETKHCCCAILPIISVCAFVKARKAALSHVFGPEGLREYKCGQGYFDLCGLGGRGSRCPVFMMYSEACLLPSCSVSGTRLLIMDRYQLEPDECDNRLIRINNAVASLEFIVLLLPFVVNLRYEDTCSETMDCISDTSFCCVSSCMIAQVQREIKFREGRAAPTTKTMERH